jgi:acetoin utilization deacetylase AcuC-like enzyme
MGRGDAKNQTVNVPLRHGLTDTSFIYIFDKIMPMIFEKHHPDVCVVVCGADGCAGDPHKEWNLTSSAFCHVMDCLTQYSNKLVLLGGGKLREYIFV